MWNCYPDATTAGTTELQGPQSCSRGSPGVEDGLGVFELEDGSSLGPKEIGVLV